MPRTRKNNPKRHIHRNRYTGDELRDIAGRVRYVGSQYHKRHPGNFGLPLPVRPLPWKTSCDEAGITDIHVAQQLLENGICRGMVRAPFDAGSDMPQFPDLVWAVSETGQPFEAQLHNSEQGHYHGYPLEPTDAVYAEVLQAWNARA
jgi:hypothetical protein